MGRQCTLFLTPADMQRLEADLANQAVPLIIAGRLRCNELEFQSHLSIRRMGDEWLTLYLTRPEDLEQIRLLETTDQGYWHVDSLRSPVVEFCRCYYGNGILRCGRLFFDTGYYDNTGHWIDKSDQFLTWADAVLAQARRTLYYDKTLQSYFGTDAARLWREGLVELKT